MQLYRICLKVRPAVAHPLYWDFQFGYLQAWLFAESAEQASGRAWKIVEQLPYETVDTRVAVYPADEPSENAKFESHRCAAKEIGLALAFFAIETGGEGEEEFEREDPL